MLYAYRVVFETDVESGEIVVSLPGLNHIADSGESIEEALENLQELAAGFIGVLQAENEPIPVGDPPGKGFYLFLEAPDPDSVRV